MNKILQLSREYRKLNHLELLPHTNNEILEKLFFLYDEKWEEQSQYFGNPSGFRRRKQM